MSDPARRPEPLFVTEGYFLALPPTFPGVAAPPFLEDCRLIRLAGGNDGVVFAAAAGPDPHIFQFMPKAPNGYAVSWRETGGGVLGMDVLTLNSGEYLALLMKSGGNLQLVLRQKVQASEGIQEWWAVLPDFKREMILGDGPVAGMVSDPRPGQVLVADSSTLWSVRVDPGSGFEITNRRSHGGGELFRVSAECAVLADRVTGVVSLIGNGIPVSPLELPDLRGATAVSVGGGRLLWASPAGNIYSWCPAQTFADLHGAVGLAPVSALARLPDERIYCFAGDEIAHWFRLDPGDEHARDLGVAVSVLSTRRYGFEFSAVLPGPGGELYCAEKDRGGHLWLYLPPPPSALN